jgi:uncharacterized protein
VELEATSWVFEPGHRVRLALATSDWPNIWPPPTPGTLTLDRATLELELPAVDGPAASTRAPAFARASGEDSHAAASDDPQPPVVWRIEHDVLGRETRAVTRHGADYDGHEGARVEERYDGLVAVSTADPGSARAEATASYRIGWPQATVRTEARLDLRSNADAYHVVVDVVAEELDADPDGSGFRVERRFERAIPRRC